jgi:hypothetical protein
MLVTLVAVVLSVVLPDNELRAAVECPEPINALAKLAGNKFDAWTISHRIEFQLKPRQVEVAPMPRWIDQ